MGVGSPVCEEVCDPRVRGAPWVCAPINGGCACSPSQHVPECGVRWAHPEGVGGPVCSVSARRTGGAASVVPVRKRLPGGRAPAGGAAWLRAWSLEPGARASPPPLLR